MGTEHVVVVVDSTLAVPPEDAERYGIRIVPVHVVDDGRSLREGVDISPAQVAERLRSGARLTTSRPSPQEFLEVYRSLADAGATGIVSIHLSAELSGTVESARLAATASPVTVEVVDTRTITMAGGYAAIDAAATAAVGGSAADAARAANQTAAATSLYFYVDTLEYLRRGGRIGAAQRYVGQALRVKPLLSMRDGVVTGHEKVRTSSKALHRLSELAVEAADRLTGPRLAIHHLQASAAATSVREELCRRLPQAAWVESEVGAVIGAHTGPGMVAVAIAPGAPQ